MDFMTLINIATAITVALQKARHIHVGDIEEILAPDYNIDGDPDGIRIKYKDNVYELEGFVVKKVS